MTFDVDWVPSVEKRVRDLGGAFAKTGHNVQKPTTLA